MNLMTWGGKRQGAGRKQSGRLPTQKIAISQDDLDWLRKQAAENKTSIAAVVRTIIRQHRDKQEPQA